MLGLRKAWRALAAQLEAKPSTLALKVLVTPKLLAEQSARTCTLVVIHDQGRQVGRSAGRQVAKSESLGPRKVQRDNWAEVTQAGMPTLGHVERPTHTTGCLPKLRRRFHGWVKLLIGVHSYLRLSDYFSQIIYFCLRIFLFLFDFIDWFFSLFYWIYASLTPC